MARRTNGDDLLMEDELTAAFLGEEDLAASTNSAQPQQPTTSGTKKKQYRGN